MATCSILLPNTHSVVLSIYVRAGIKYESGQHIGVSHLIEHLLFRRLHDIDQKQLYYKMECMGTTLRAITYNEFIRFYIEVLPKYVSEAFDLIYKVLLDSQWSHEDIRLEKAVVINQINKRQFTYSDQIKLDLWDETPFSNLIMGTKSKIKALSSNTIKKYHNKFFQPQNCCFVVSGNVSEKQIEKMHSSLSCLNNSSDIVISTQPVFPLRFTNRTEYDDIIYDICDNYISIKLCFEIDYNVVKPELAEYLHSILGDGVGSRLSTVLRERLGLVDEIYTTLDKYNGFSILSINYDVFHENVFVSLDSVFTMLKEMKNDINERDIHTSSPFLTDNWELLYDSPETLNFHYGWKYVLNEIFESPDVIVSKFKCISIDMLKKAASQLFVSKNMMSFIYNNGNLQKSAQIEKRLKYYRLELDDV